jgi:hypothetical protein
MKRALILSVSFMAAAAALPASAQLLGGQGSVTGGLTGQVDRTQSTVGGSLGAQGQIGVDPSSTMESETGKAKDAATRARSGVEATANSAYNTAHKAKHKAQATTQSALDTAAQAPPSSEASASVSGNASVSSDGASAQVGAQGDAKVEK